MKKNFILFRAVRLISNASTFFIRFIYPPLADWVVEGAEEGDVVKKFHEFRKFF